MKHLMPIVLMLILVSSGCTLKPPSLAQEDLAIEENGGVIFVEVAPMCSETEMGDAQRDYSANLQHIDFIEALFSLTKDDSLAMFNDFAKTIVKDGEEYNEGYCHKEYGLTIIFSDRNKDEIEKIDKILCSENAHIDGIHMGMTIEEIVRQYQHGYIVFQTHKPSPSVPDYLFLFEYGKVMIRFGADGLTEPIKSMEILRNLKLEYSE